MRHDTAHLLNEITELQTKLAFQDDLIEQLNQALVSQQNQIHKLEYQMKHVVSKVKNMSVSNLASEDEETPPPHY
ncbi:SlyX family protein [Alteromonas sp. a30]|uniref:SlyX family protein n=1 Tax=Alteromonas sp. a30 TaxID=2730917 RepID=UPI00228057A6|nr:SlyX family protein [Alteromonas sp. a30]MCY7295648.1 SlyX family protein [Alteromonas sp. a30]